MCHQLLPTPSTREQTGQTSKTSGSWESPQTTSVWLTGSGLGMCLSFPADALVVTLDKCHSFSHLDE